VAAWPDAELRSDAPSLAEIGGPALRFYLGAARSGRAPRPGQRNRMAENFVLQLQNCHDRSGVDRLLTRLRHRIEFISDPLVAATQLGGQLAGELTFASSGNVFDFGVTLFELTPHRQCVEICAYWARAGHPADERPRVTAIYGRRHQLSFQSGRGTNRLLAAGSRVIVVLGVVPQHVETSGLVAGAEALRIRWHSDSFVEVPVRERERVC
jgi:hypothetical protein